MKMRYLENWALSVDRIRDYFDKEYQIGFTKVTLDLRKEAVEFQTRIQNTSVILRPLADNGIMIFPIPRTEIEIQGPDEETELIHHRFMMNFLSAGG